MHKKALGKGLDALIEKNKSEPRKKSWVTNLPLDKIDASSLQPRKNFSNEELKHLSESIKNKGVLQPVLVRQKEDRFELIAGERRFRSAKIAGIKNIPAVIKQVSDEELLQLSLIENVQRENLTSVEEALAYRQLQTDFNFSQQDIAEKVGKDRSTVSNYLRLLTLPKIVLDKLNSGAISFGHAKAILGLEYRKQRIKLCNRILNKGLSVRETEKVVSAGSLAVAPGKVKKRKKETPPEIKDVEEELSKKLGTKTQIRPGKKKGKIQIEFYSDKDLQRILDILME